MARCPCSTDSKLFVLSIALFANAVAMSNPFPYAPFMVTYYGLTSDRKSIGFYSGLVISCFMLGRLVSAYPLGLLSDLYGRRPVIEVGLWSCIVFQLAFGMAPTFEFALAMRFLMGAFNGIIGVSKAWLPELVPPSQQGFGMSMIAGMWGIGQIVGPALGGLLSEKGFDAFPFLLPNLLCAAFAMVALVFVRRHLPNDAPPRSGPARQLRAAAAESGKTSLVSADGAAAAAAAAAAAEEEGQAAAAAAEAAAAGPAAGREATGSAAGSSPPPPRARCRWTLGVPRSSLMPLLLYCLHSGLTIFYEEAFPLWLIAPLSAGGLGWSAEAIGSLLSAGGFFLAVSQFLIFPRLAKVVPATSLFKWSLGLLGLIFAATPYLSGTGPLLLPLLLIQNALNKAVSSTGFTSIFLVINNSCTSRQRGRVNGLGMSVASGFKALGPVLGAVLFAWSLTNGIRSPLLDVHFVFLLCGLFYFLTLLLAHRCLSPANDRALDEPSPQETAVAPAVELEAAAELSAAESSTPAPAPAADSRVQ